ncbi:unnamed protein product [Rotaria socialis]|uniref:Uncharacterized protein n=1 Tax=Rotaria socialis TaxID=392032 RepID=A0A820WM99_9BILA|nr:unnamed protein product [Rotaria socialis]CAF3250609.1 unnamed protein product [Rotaria socialis]CAF3346648.1 unnamed protein product [Rotaria socialis]CAF3382107.1 unnamed protein product [Rotaria socialis]CAF3751887.1 unnamed protein product [Rotaria socialis]
MKGMNGKLEWVLCIGKLGAEDLYQNSRAWLFDDKGRERPNTMFIEKEIVDLRMIKPDPRPHRPFLIWKKNKQQ